MIIAVFLMLWFYKRNMRKEIKGHMQMQVSAMVSQYFELNEGKFIKQDNL